MGVWSLSSLPMLVGTGSLLRLLRPSLLRLLRPLLCRVALVGIRLALGSDPLIVGRTAHVSLCQRPLLVQSGHEQRPVLVRRKHSPHSWI